MRLSRLRRIEIASVAITFAIVSAFVFMSRTAQGFQISLSETSDTTNAGESVTFDATIDIPADQFLTSVELQISGPVRSFTQKIPLLPGTFDLTDELPSELGQLQVAVSFIGGIRPGQRRPTATRSGSRLVTFGTRSLSNNLPRSRTASPSRSSTRR